MRFRRYAWYASVAALSGALALACGGGDKLVLPQDAVPAAVAIIKGDGQTGTVGAPLTDSLVVRVTDSNNRPVEDQAVEFTVTAGGGTITPARAVTNADGRAAARWVLGSGAGTQRAQAKVTGNGAPANLIAAFSASAGSAGATTLAAVSGTGQTAIAGGALTDSLVVRVTDATGNPVAGAGVAWAVSDNGSVSAPNVVTGADGRAAVKRTLGTTAGPQTTTATSGTLAGSPVTFTATATVGSAGQLTISRQPSGAAQSGVAFSQQPQVQLRDVNGNPVAQVGVAVAVELGSGPSGGSIIGSTVAATDATGLATFSGLGLSGPSGSYTLNFTGATQPFTGVTSSPVLIGSGSGSKLGLSVPPSATASSGIPLATQPRIQLQDAAGNPVAQAGVTVAVQAVTVSGGPVSLGGTTTATTDASGLATFANLSLSGPAGSQVTLSFASPGLTGTGSNTITLGSGTVSSANSTLQVTGSPITASSGSSAATVTVTARDADNNVVSGAAVAVSVTGINEVSAPAVTDANGRSTVTVSSTQAGIKTVTATINGTAVTQQGSITVNPAAPSASQSTVTAAPTTILAVTGTSTITVTVKDQFGNAVSGASVTLSVTGTATNTLTQPVGATDAAGVTQGSLASTSAGAKVVSASATKAPAGAVAITQTATVTVGTGSADPTNSTLVLSSGTLTVGVGSVTATVTARDAGNNLLPGAAVSVSVTGTNVVTQPAGGVANGSGVAVATIASTEAGIKTVTATVNGTTLATQPTLTVSKAATATGLSLAPATTQVGQPVTASWTVTPQGAGTPTGTVAVTGAGGSCSNPVASGSCVLTPTTAGVSATFTATYAGDGNFIASSGTATRTVTAAATTTAITSDTPDPSNVGQAVTVSFTVTPVAPGGGTPAGTVTVGDGVNSCTATLPATSCTVALTTLGARTLTASYAGNANYGASAGTASHQVQANGATVAVSASPVSSVTGQTVTFTATVSGSSVTPTGTVQFQVDAANLGSPVALSGGVAQASAALNAGAHVITANYGGDANYGSASGSIGSYIVSKGATSTSIVDNGPAPSVAGSAYSVSFSVSPIGGASGAPGGTVTVSDGTGASCSGAAPFGSCSITSTTAGSKSLTASYAGDANFSASTSAAVSHTVNLAAATVALTSSANPSVTGQTVTLSATVTGAAGVPAGTVQFVVDGSNSGSPAALNGSGVASLVTSALGVGAHTVSGSYGGSATYAAASGSLPTQTVGQGATTTAIARTGGTSPSAVGASVTFTATINATAPASGPRTGTVQFKQDGANLGSAVVVSGNAASISTTAILPTGSPHSITAVYSGDVNFTGSTSPAVLQTVTAASPVVGVTSSVNPSVAGQSVTFTASASGGSGVPTGTFQFKVDGAPIGAPVALVAGSAATTTAALTVGTHVITADYGGDATYATATATLSGGQTVDQAATTTTLTRTSGTSPSAAGASVTFAATITSALAGTPTGTVQFKDNGLNSGSPVALVGGVATLTTSSLTAGAHTMTAVYGGDATYAGSTSAALAQSVTAGPPSAASSTVTALPATITAGGAGSTVTVTVKDAFGNPLSGVAVTLSASPAAGATLSAPALTNASGVTTSTFSATVANTYTVTAVAGGVTITGTATIIAN